MNTKGLFIGLTTLDIQYFVNEHPLANTKIKADAPVIAAGGPSANAAIAYAVLGGQAHFLTCIGENDFASFLKNDIEKQNVLLFDAFKNIEFKPIVASVVTNITNSHRTIITHHPEADVAKQVNVNDINIEDYAFVFTDGFYPEIALPFLKEARTKKVPVIFDGGSWKPQMPKILPFVDIGIFSGNFNPPGCETNLDIFKYVEKAGVKFAAISRGNESIVTPDGEIAVEQVKAVDSLGAGDILHGAFCKYYFEYNNFTKALQYASKVATFSTQYKGTREWILKWKNK